MFIIVQSKKDEKENLSCPKRVCSEMHGVNYEASLLMLANNTMYSFNCW